MTVKYFILSFYYKINKNHQPAAINRPLLSITKQILDFVNVYQNVLSSTVGD